MAKLYHSSVETIVHESHRLFLIIPRMHSGQWTAHVTTEFAEAVSIAGILKADSNVAHIESIEFKRVSSEGWNAEIFRAKKTPAAEDDRGGPSQGPT